MPFRVGADRQSHDADRQSRPQSEEVETGQVLKFQSILCQAQDDCESAAFDPERGVRQKLAFCVRRIFAGADFDDEFGVEQILQG